MIGVGQSTYIRDSQLPPLSMTSATITAAAREHIRKEPAEEFFTMMLLSFKLNNQKCP